MNTDNIAINRPVRNVYVIVHTMIDVIRESDNVERITELYEEAILQDEYYPNEHLFRDQWMIGWVACEFGRIKCLRYMFEHGLRLTYELFKRTIHYCIMDTNHRECVEFFHQHGFDIFEPYVVGHLLASCRCLRYLYEQGFKFPSSELLFASAAANGHFESIKFLHSIECTWDQQATKNAASNGRLQFLWYLISHGCPYDEDEIVEQLYIHELEWQQRECAEYCQSQMIVTTPQASAEKEQEEEPTTENEEQEEEQQTDSLQDLFVQKDIIINHIEDKKQDFVCDTVTVYNDGLYHAIWTNDDVRQFLFNFYNHILLSRKNESTTSNKQPTILFHLIKEKQEEYQYQKQVAMYEASLHHVPDDVLEYIIIPCL